MTDVIFAADFYIGNRQRLREKLNLAKNEFAILPAHFKLQKTHDEAYKFVQDSSFFYLTGIREPDCLVIITKDSEMLLSPPINPHHQLWEGQAGIEQMKQISGIADVQNGKEGSLKLRQLVEAAISIYMPLPYDKRLLRTYFRMTPNPARTALYKKIKSLNSAVEVKDLRSTLADLRMVKQPIELTAIREAVRITLESIETVHQKLAQLHTEKEVHALLEYEFLHRGAEGPGFDSIVASGANTTQIHYMNNDKTPLDKNLVLLDVGAQVHGYKADIGRVVSKQGFTERQQQIYEAVEALQQYAFSLLKPGVKIREYEQQVEQKTEELTRDLRLSKHHTISRKARITPHAVSHHLGLDAHDAANYDAPLASGMVLAVEPGIYILEEGIGMRIEDDVLVTENGIEVLSKALPQVDV